MSFKLLNLILQVDLEFFWVNLKVLFPLRQFLHLASEISPNVDVLGLNFLLDIKHELQNFLVLFFPH